MKHEQKIPFRNQADQIVSFRAGICLSMTYFITWCLQPDIEAGDVIVLLQITDHPDFKRDGHDLHMTKKITLVEALCGFTIYVTHLDKRVLCVKCPPGKVIEPSKLLTSCLVNIFSTKNFVYVHMEVCACACVRVHVLAWCVQPRVPFCMCMHVISMFCNYRIINMELYN